MSSDPGKLLWDSIKDAVSPAIAKRRETQEPRGSFRGMPLNELDATLSIFGAMTAPHLEEDAAIRRAAEQFGADPERLRAELDRHRREPPHMPDWSEADYDGA